MNFKTIASAALIAIFATTTVANAQSSYKMGFTLGSNYSSLRSDLYTTASGRLSPAAGFTITLGFGDRFELSPEIMFVQKGATAKTVQFNPENQPSVSTYDFHYNSFEAGVFAGYQPIATVPIRLQAGGFFGTHFHNLDRSQKDEYVGDYNNVVNATKAISIVKPTEFVRELTHFVGHLTKPLELVLVAILAMRLTMLMATVRFPSRTLTARTSKPTTHADCAQPVTS